MDELRSRGLPVSIGERIDAMQAVEVLGFDTEGSLHTALSATLVKVSEHRGVFDEVFNLYFRVGRSPLPLEPATAELGAETTTDVAWLDLDHAVRSVLRDGSEALARMIAEQAVAQFAGFERGRMVAGVLYERLTLKGLRLDAIAAEMAGEMGGGGPQGSASSGRQLGFELERDLVAERLATLRQQVREVIRELLVADRGVDAVAKTIRTPLPTEVAITMANRAQLAEIDRILKPLQRKLATMMMRKRRRRTGVLDVGKTLRASMATGGVPMRVVHRKPTPSKPQLFVLADMSGSVASFAAFTVSLVSAMSQEFSKLRTFAFVENAVDVTELFKKTGDPVKAIQAINEMQGLTFLDASTDYGRALKQFWREVGPQLGRRSTVLIFGDGRGNYRPAEEETLVHIAKKAGTLYWLNPEQLSLWGTGDSLMRTYARHCTEAVSVRTLTDLRHFVERLD
jgi:uncharacterized protein with von Willebrand factor type A (vWA) domain